MMKVSALGVEVTIESVPDGRQPTCSCAQLAAQMDQCTNECDSESHRAWSRPSFGWLTEVEASIVNLSLRGFSATESEIFNSQAVGVITQHMLLFSMKK